MITGPQYNKFIQFKQLNWHCCNEAKFEIK